ncbi:MAG: homoserine O-succinyltransferase [Clostridiales bacterium]|nr:homoserine O-succinyltransferase [Clostridiales bacterium]
MPIIIPKTLPASEILRQENIFVMNKKRAEHQDIRPLEIIILNLMPEKVETETQLIRLLSNTPLQVNLTLLKTSSYKSKNVSVEHLNSFYKTFDQIKDLNFDGMIITGAPVEHMAFEEVDYWDELVDIMNYSQKHVTSTLHICWGAQAGLYHHYGIEKFLLNKKIFGIYDHKRLSDTHSLLRGFDTSFKMPHSRYSEIRKNDIIKHEKLELLSYSEEVGVCLVSSKDLKHIFISGHPEYNQESLAGEYFRDLDKGVNISIPKNYFGGDDPKNSVNVSWRGHAHLLFSNWINYCVYQLTPFYL